MINKARISVVMILCNTPVTFYTDSQHAPATLKTKQNKTLLLTICSFDSLEPIENFTGLTFLSLCQFQWHWDIARCIWNKEFFGLGRWDSYVNHTIVCIMCNTRNHQQVVQCWSFWSFYKFINKTTSSKYKITSFLKLLIFFRLYKII